MLQKNVKFVLIFLACLVSRIIYSHMHYDVLKKKAIKEVSTKGISTKKISGYSMVKIAPERLQLFGVTTEKVTYKKLIRNIRTVGIVNIDETRISHVQTKFTGWIQELYADFVGMPVKKNQPLFSVYSPELLSTQEEYLSTLEEVKQPMEGKFGKEFNKSGRDLLRSTKDRLLLWDISEEDIDLLEKNKTPSKTLVFRSSVDGIIIEKNAFIGMNVAPGMKIYNISNLLNVWVLADIYENDIDLVRLGQKGEIYFSSVPEKIFKSEITFLDYVLENKTRTMKVRFEIENKDMKLKPGMFATVNINIDLGVSLALPEESLINTGERNIVFIEKKMGMYEPREIKIGFKAQNYYQILSGVSEGEKVVTSAQFLLDSESRLKALAPSMHVH